MKTQYPAFEIEADGGILAFEQDETMDPQSIAFVVNRERVEINREQLDEFCYRLYNLRNNLNRQRLGIEPGVW